MKSCLKFLRKLVATVHFQTGTESLNPCILLIYREIITDKTVTPCKKPCFFNKKYKNQEKEEAATSFPLLCQTRNMVGQFKKTHLHRPIKILQFLTPVRIQKCLT